MHLIICELSQKPLKVVYYMNDVFTKRVLEEGFNLDYPIRKPRSLVYTLLKSVNYPGRNHYTSNEMEDSIFLICFISFSFKYK